MKLYTSFYVMWHSIQARDAEIAKQMKEEHERAASALKQKQLEEYEANVRYQQELERQLEVC